MPWQQADLVYTITSQIPKGKVLTYGQLAKLAGAILHQNPDPEKVPYHRVVNKQGKVAKQYAFGGGKEQAKKLAVEGVTFKCNTVDLAASLWKPTI